MFDRRETTLALSMQGGVSGWDQAPAPVGRAPAACPVREQAAGQTAPDMEDAHAPREEVTDLAARLAEANHRARNNLQLVVNMLLLEAARLETSARTVLVQLADRVAAIGLIHYQLDVAPGAKRVAFGAALRGLCERIAAAYGGLAEITADVGEDPCEVDALTAMRLSLVANEVITNALKHAFPDGRRGRIVVQLRCAGPERTLSVTDDGAGYNPTVACGTGSRLIGTLCKAAGGTMRYQKACDGGTLFTVTF
jgi:two-component sensor histidine kinase